MSDTRKLLQLLLENEIDLVLIGGMAAIVYGSSMLTEDLDVCFSFKKENVAKLLKAVETLHPQIRSGPKRIALEDHIGQITQFKNLYLATDWGVLDLLGEVGGLGNFEQLGNHTVEMNLFGYPCRVLDIDSLIEAKKFMGRPKDKQTILQLMAIREKLRKQE